MFPAWPQPIFPLVQSCSPHPIPLLSGRGPRLAELRLSLHFNDYHSVFWFFVGCVVRGPDNEWASEHRVTSDTRHWCRPRHTACADRVAGKPLPFERPWCSQSVVLIGTTLGTCQYLLSAHTLLPTPHCQTHWNWVLQTLVFSQVEANEHTRIWPF
jgi:hypothetical protein